MERNVRSLISTVRTYLVLVLISGIVVVLDQWTKYLVRTSLEVGESWFPLPDFAPFLRIVHWHNTGAAFGIFPQASTIFTVVAVVVAIVIVVYWPRVPAGQWALRLALAMQLGGALGNLTSRLTLGVVTDFIAVGNFPVFNVADSSISVGVAILVIATWIDERRVRKAQGLELDEDEPGSPSPEADPSV
jgi:signal peptidase II